MDAPITGSGLHELPGERGLRGQAALVTGAASGLGAHIAHDLAAAGALVGVLDRDPDGVAEVAEGVLAAGGWAFALLADLTDRAAVARAVDRFMTAAGRLDILVTCATVVPDRPLLAMDMAAWQAVFAVNVGGTLAATEAVAPVMERQRYGRIVHLDASAASSDPSRGRAAAKGALAPLTQSYALRLGPSGVTVNCVATGLLRPAGRPPGAKLPEWATTAGPARNWASVADVAAAVRFLVSPQAGFVRGQVFQMPGAGDLRQGSKGASGVA